MLDSVYSYWYMNLVLATGLETDTTVTLDLYNMLILDS